MNPGSRGPSRSAQPNPIGNHRAGKQTPRKRDRSEQQSYLTTPASSILSSLSSTNSSKSHSVNAETGQYSSQRTSHATSGIQREIPTSGTRKTTSMQAQTQTQREVTQAVSTFYLRQRQLFNPPLGQREEVGDNMSQPKRNPQLTRPKLVSSPKRNSNSEAQNVVASDLGPTADNLGHVQDDRAKVQNPKRGGEIFQKELQKLSALKREGGSDVNADPRTGEGILACTTAMESKTDMTTNLSKPAEQQLRRQAQARRQMRREILSSRRSNPVGTTTIRALGQDILAMSRNTSTACSGARSETSDPFCTLDSIEVEMMHELILKHN